MAHGQRRRGRAWVGVIPILLAVVMVWAHHQHSRQVRAMDRLQTLRIAVDAVLIQPSTDRIHALSELARDNPEHRDRIIELEQLVRAGNQQASLRGLMEMFAAEGDRELILLRQAAAATESIVDMLLLLLVVCSILLLVWAHWRVKGNPQEIDVMEQRLVRMHQDMQDQGARLSRLQDSLEKRVAERTATLERSNSDLRQFAYIVSHDLQEPLRMVSSYVALLVKNSHGTLNAECERYASVAIESATRMRAMIVGLLTYVREGGDALTVTMTSLADVIGQATYSLYESIQESGAEITTGDLPEVNVDPLRMSVVFQNLFSNAIKFRKPGERPRVHVDAVAEGSNWTIRVHDMGVGFDPKYAQRIFSVGQRLNGRAQYPGAGMGLAISKRIVESHGGRIWAESTVGDGAIFYVALPQRANARPRDASEVPDVPNNALQETDVILGNYRR